MPAHLRTSLFQSASTALNPRGVVQGEYVQEVLGKAVRPLAAREPHAIVIARERQSIAAAESRSKFDIELAVPAVSVSEDELLQVRHSLSQAPCQLHASMHHRYMCRIWQMVLCSSVVHDSYPLKRQDPVVKTGWPARWYVTKLGVRHVTAHLMCRLGPSCMSVSLSCNDDGLWCCRSQMGTGRGWRD